MFDCHSLDRKITSTSLIVTACNPKEKTSQSNSIDVVNISLRLLSSGKSSMIKYSKLRSACGLHGKFLFDSNQISPKLNRRSHWDLLLAANSIAIVEAPSQDSSNSNYEPKRMNGKVLFLSVVNNIWTNSKHYKAILKSLIVGLGSMMNHAMERIQQIFRCTTDENQIDVLAERKHAGEREKISFKAEILACGQFLRRHFLQRGRLVFLFPRTRDAKACHVCSIVICSVRLRTFLSCAHYNVLSNA